MKRALALSAALLLGGCEAELNHLLSYDDVRRGHANPAQAAPPAQPPTAPAAAPPARSAASQPVALMPVEPPNMAFCRGVAEGDARTSAFDSATRRAQYERSLAQCLAVHGN